jgi:MFS superfamily sulfate permease-like transporter
MGWVANFISKAVMAGFITGMAIQIIVGQLGKLLGIDTGDGNTFEKLWSAITQVGDWNTTAVVLGVGSLVLIFGLQRTMPKVPAALTAVAIASVLVVLLDPAIDIVASIPQGLPSVGLPSGIDLDTWLTLLVGGAVVLLVAFSEGWGASSELAEKTHDDLDTNQEFRAYGIGNLGAGILGGMGVTGSLSKSAAAEAAGARTQVSNILLAGMVLLTLLFFAPLFQWLPETVLAAIVINAMWGAASPRKLERLWRVDHVDFVLALATFLVVLTLDLLPAMIAGIVLSILYMVYRLSFPGRSVLGRVPATGDYEAMRWQYGQRSGAIDSDAEAVPGVIVYRFSAPLVFSNAGAFKQTGQDLLIEAAAKEGLPHTVVVDCEEIFLVDSTGAAALSHYHAYAERYGVDLRMARVHSGTHELLTLAGVVEEIGEDRLHDTVRGAVDAAIAKTTDHRRESPST